MNTFVSLYWSTVGRKFWTALTGICLVGFVIVHLVGNLTLFMGNQAMNDYAYFLETALHGGLRPFGELALLVLFGVHALTALSATLQNRRGRTQGYAVSRPAGGRSHQTLSSRTMVVTGLILLAFLVLHVAQFRFSVGFDWHVTAESAGSAHPVRDVYRTVVEAFHTPLWMGIYLFVMALLGFHLRHGIWSAFQTLGTINTPLRRALFVLGAVLAVLLALGFLVLPVYIYAVVDPAGPFQSAPSTLGGAR